MRKPKELLEGHQMNKVEELLTVDELAGKLKVKRSWIYSRVREGKLPHLKCGKYLRFNWNDVVGTM